MNDEKKDHKELKVEQLAIVNVDKVSKLLTQVYDILYEIVKECGLDD